MYFKLSELCSLKKIGSFYNDIQKSHKFYYGSIIAVNEKETAINKISPFGDADGTMVIPTDTIYRIELDGLYHEKMKKLYNLPPNPEYSQKIDPENIMQSMLEIAMEMKGIVSLELKNSGYDDVIGFVREIKNGMCKIRYVDEYGEEDGDTYFLINDITMLDYNRKEEKSKYELWSKTAQKK